MHIIRSIIAFICLFTATTAQAAISVDAPGVRFQPINSVASVPLFISDAGDNTRTTGQGDILDSLDESSAEPDAKKKCMMVCERWGEDCVINPRTGVRKCRRVCKKLTQECF
ncbi:MAG: hypothetical protein MI725_08940 [Pirellulales bacterium]|nr:hypothetical protein [Pirellulales bacterium]